MHRPGSSVIVLALFACLWGAAAAAPLPQNSRQPADVPLEFDPARPEPIDGWWTNGQQLMRLDSNGAYRLWLTEDRFARPAELGAWRRTNYILFDLEPYRAKAGTRFRVQLIKEGGETRMARDGMAPFARSQVPPRVFGDEVLGVWTAEREQLLVLDTGRYEYRRTGSQPGISQHDGVWHTEGRTLHLTPDTPAVAPVALEGVPDGESALALRGPGGLLRAYKPEPPVAEQPATPPAAPTPATPAPSAPAAPAPPAAPPTPAAPPGNAFVARLGGFPPLP